MAKIEDIEYLNQAIDEAAIDANKELLVENKKNISGRIAINEFLKKFDSNTLKKVQERYFLKKDRGDYIKENPFAGEYDRSGLIESDNQSDKPNNVIDTIKTFIDTHKPQGKNLIGYITNNDMTAAKQLIESGTCWLNVNDSKGKTPLMLAIEKEQPEIAGLLTKHGADVNASAYGETALDMAIRTGQNDIAKTLVENGAEMSDKSFKKAAKQEIADKLRDTLNNPDSKSISEKLGVEGDISKIINDKTAYLDPKTKLKGFDRVKSLFKDSQEVRIQRVAKNIQKSLSKSQSQDFKKNFTPHLINRKKQPSKDSLGK